MTIPLIEDMQDEDDFQIEGLQFQVLSVPSIAFPVRCNVELTIRMVQSIANQFSTESNVYYKCNEMRGN